MFQEIYPIIHKLGDIRWVYQFGSGVFDQNNHLLFLEGFIVDITTEKTTEEIYRLTKNTAFEIIEAIPSGFFIYQFQKPDKLYLMYANPETKHLSREDINDFLGKEFDEIWPEANKTLLKESFLNVVFSRKTFTVEEFQYNDLHTKGIFRIRVFNLPGDRLAIAFENTSRLHLAEKKLHENEKILNSIFQYSPIHIYIKDSPLHFRKLSNSMEKLIGIPVQNLENHSLEEVLHLTGACKNEWLDALVQDDSGIFSDKKSTEIVEELNKQTFRTIKFPIILDNDRTFIVAFTIDITEFKQLETTLRKRIDELDRFNRLTVDRELKMIELKKEVNQLLKELGKEAKYRIIE
jgi:PAS domain S-box-containing protein